MFAVGIVLVVVVVDTVVGPGPTDHLRLNELF